MTPDESPILPGRCRQRTGSVCASRSTIAPVPSGELSSTTMISPSSSLARKTPSSARSKSSIPPASLYVGTTMEKGNAVLTSPLRTSPAGSALRERVGHRQQRDGGGLGA